MLSALGFREELSKCLLHEAQTARSSRARTFICEISFLWILWSSCNSAQLLHLQLVLMKLKLLAIWRVQLLPPEGEIKRKIATPPLPASAPSYEKGRWFRLNWKSWANLVGSFFVTPREFYPLTRIERGRWHSCGDAPGWVLFVPPRMASPSFWVQQLERVPHTRKKLPPN